jgi:hypothetical protein
MTTSIHSRAKAGGQFGANGEWYEGGKFIATTSAAKKHKVSSQSTKRVEIETGVWVAGRDGFRPIYGSLAGVEIFNRATGMFCFNPDLRGENFASADAINYRKAMISQWNQGMRWKAVSH